jgi:hypothetical protein
LTEESIGYTRTRFWRILPANAFWTEETANPQILSLQKRLISSGALWPRLAGQGEGHAATSAYQTGFLSIARIALKMNRL